MNKAEQIKNLENDYVHLFIKDPNDKDPLRHIRDQSSPALMSLSKECIHEFVDYMIKRKDILEDLNTKLISEFDVNDVWLDYYHNNLTQMIREIKLKRLC